MTLEARYAETLVAETVRCALEGQAEVLEALKDGAEHRRRPGREVTRKEILRDFPETG